MIVRKKYPVKEGYGKIKTPEKVVAKVRQPKKVAAPKGSKVRQELGYLSKAVKTMKGKDVAKADKVEEAKNCGCGQNPCVTYGTNDSVMEAERKLADRLARKRKVYDKTTKKAMQYARDEGEAAGHARYRMSSISREMDGIKARMKEKEKEK